MISALLDRTNNDIIIAAGAVCSFLITFAAILWFRTALPRDHGRQYAVNGELSQGKPRGAGIILITAYCLCAALFVPLSAERLIYLLLLCAAMMTGFLDDAAEKPWGELKKGLLDLCIAIATAVNFIVHNSCEIALFGHKFALHPVLYGALAVILVWASINVTNCSDGVDGLCSTVYMVSVYSFSLIIDDMYFTDMCSIMLCCTMAYLWFNASPSKLLMGDAGSRAFGVFLAVCAMKTGSPLLFIPLCLVLIVDGGIGLLKLSVRRFLRIRGFMEKIRTPLHDHMRKNKGWSDTQTVFRFALIQVLIAAAVLYLK